MATIAFPIGGLGATFTADDVLKIAAGKLRTHRISVSSLLKI